MDTHAILCRLVEPLNRVAYGHVLVERVTEEVGRMLTAVNVGRVFTQPLTLVLPCSIEAARTPLLNSSQHSFYFFCNFLNQDMSIDNTV